MTPHTMNLCRIAFLVVIGFVLASSEARAQVTYDNNLVIGSINTNATLTVPNVTVASGNKALLVVAVNNSNSLVPTSVTYNAQALTLLQTSSNSTSRIHIYYRALGDLAASVTASVVVTMPSAPANQTVFAYSLKNVDQTTPLSNPGTVTFAGTATSSSASVAGAIGDMALDFIYGAGNSSGAAPTFTATGSGQTEIGTRGGTNSNGFGIRISASRKTQTTGSATMSWTVSFPTTPTGAGIQAIANVRSANKTYTTIANGNWNSAATWAGGAIPPAAILAGEKIQVLHAVNQDVDYTLAASATLEIGATGSLTVAPGKTLTNNGDLKNAGALTNNGAVTDAGTTTFNGSTAQSVGGAAAPSLNKVVINNAAGVTFNTPAEIGDSLTLTNGNVSMMGANTLTIGPLGSITRTSGYVIGTLKKEFAGVGSFTYPVGTAAGYAPVTAVVNTLGGGDFSVTANDGALPGTIAGQSLTRNWTLTRNNISSADITLNYNDADVPVGADESQFQFVRRSTGTNIQIVPTNFDTTANSFTLLGVTGFSDWTLGKMAGPLAAMVDVSGRILTASGRGISNVRIALTDQNGFTRYVNSSSLGYYRFTEIESGQMYTLTVGAKRFTFTEPTRLLFVFEAMANQDFVADP